MYVLYDIASAALMLASLLQHQCAMWEARRTYISQIEVFYDK